MFSLIVRGECVGPALLAALLIAQPAWVQAEGADNEQWEEIAREDGIVVLLHERDDDTAHAHFRGTGLVKGTVAQIFAILHDVARYTEWAFRCSEAKLLKKIAPHHLLLYVRLAAPWPVSDRDAVLLGKGWVVDPGQILRASFEAVSSPLRGPVDGVVRFPFLKGSYLLTAVDAQTTRVQYEVEVDAGGWLPSWVSRMANEGMPLNTIRNLRTQVARTKDTYKGFKIVDGTTSDTTGRPPRVPPQTTSSVASPAP